MIVSSALMIWKGLMVITGSESPIVVVLSGSMEPAFHRGDLLFLTNRVEDPIRVGEIVVFRIEGREIPIVHRVLKIHEKQNGHIKFLTKGDNNAVDDRGLYKQGQHWLEKKDVVGRARGTFPRPRKKTGYSSAVTACALFLAAPGSHSSTFCLYGLPVLDMLYLFLILGL
nr:signal peptidase complex catalytic subunit SEC11A isoform X3 [Odocoileus virginianus texanus]